MSESQKQDELVDDAVNKTRQLMEKWKNRLTLDNLRLSERYLKGEITIFIFWNVRGADQPNNLCAVFQYGERPVRLPADRSTEVDLEGHLGHIAPHIDGGSNNATDSTSSDKQEMMLVHNVKVVEFPEIPIPTVVRLDRVDEAFRSRVDSLYFSPITGFVFGRSIVDGKARLSSRRTPIGLDQLPREVVKSAPQVVDSVSGDQSETMGDRDSLLNPMDFFSSLGIVLDSESVRCLIPKRLHRRVEIVNVLVGPFDFCPDAD